MDAAGGEEKCAWGHSGEAGPGLRCPVPGHTVPAGDVPALRPERFVRMYGGDHACSDGYQGSGGVAWVDDDV